MANQIILSLEQGDILQAKADVLALKYSGSFRGADLIVAEYIATSTARLIDNLIPKREYNLIDTTQLKLHASAVLFLKTPSPNKFTYNAINEFAENTLKILKNEPIAAQHIATTIHGVGFGLDEIEALFAQISGFFEAFRAGEYPSTLQRISIFEFSPRRATRLSAALAERLRGEPSVTQVGVNEYAIDIDALRDVSRGVAVTDENATTAIEQEAAQADKKPHLFIAMPFKQELEDLWEFGIQAPIREAGFLPHRIDEESFSGAIFDQIRRQIDTSAATIAVLTGNNPNVFLELGYAMGKNKQFILIANSADELPFDVKGLRCLIYNGSIKTCRELLVSELINLKEKGQL